MAKVAAGFCATSILNIIGWAIGAAVESSKGNDPMWMIIPAVIGSGALFVASICSSGAAAQQPDLEAAREGELAHKAEDPSTETIKTTSYGTIQAPTPFTR